MSVSWKEFKKEKPAHKDLVLCWDGDVVLPAIYFNNQSFRGFYSYTTFYHTNKATIYSKVRLQPEDKIQGVLKWKIIDEPNE